MHSVLETSRMRLIAAIAITFTLFQLYTVGFGVMTPLAQRGTTLLFAMALTVLMHPFDGWLSAAKRPAWRIGLGTLVDAAFLAIAAYTCIYVIQNEAALADRSGAETDLDLWVAVLGPIVLIEMVRRTVGTALALVILAVVTYTTYGDIVLVIGLPILFAWAAWRLGGVKVFGVMVCVLALLGIWAWTSGALNPSDFQYTGVSLYRMAPYLWLTSEGTFGSIAGIMSQFIFVFIVFSALLESLGSGKVLIDLAFAGTGRFRGGPAQAAVAASSLFGMVSGSTMANVVSTGTLTIPLMVRAGFRKTFAAGVESVASSGGQIVPPIMGASVFIMAEIIGVPYAELMLYALIPAMFYFLSLSSSIFFEAGRLSVDRIPEGEIPNGRRTFLVGGFVVLPLLFLILGIIGGETPGRAGFKALMALIVMSDIARALVQVRHGYGARGAMVVAIGTAILIALAFGPISAPAFLNVEIALPWLGSVDLNRLVLFVFGVALMVIPATRVLPCLVPIWLAVVAWEIPTSYVLLGGNDAIVIGIYAVLIILGALLVYQPSLYTARQDAQDFGAFAGAIRAGMINGARNAVSLVAATFGIGMVVGLLVLTGLGVRLSILVAQVGEHSQFLSYVLVMCASLVLGMGLPTVAAYLLLVMVVAPSMEQLGTHIVAAHLFVFYYGVLSSITPPVALAAFGAAGIARVDPLATALSACRLALSAFIVPYLFVYYPELLLLEGTTLSDTAYRFIMCGFGIWLLSAAMMRYGFANIGRMEQAALIVVALLLFLAPVWANMTGLVGGLALMFWQRQRAVA